MIFPILNIAATSALASQISRNAAAAASRKKRDAATVDADQGREIAPFNVYVCEPRRMVMFESEG